MNNPQNPQNPSSTPTTANPEQVAARAYELFQQRGGAPGYELEDWLEAERQLTLLPASPHDEPRRRPSDPH